MKLGSNWQKELRDFRFEATRNGMLPTTDAAIKCVESFQIIPWKDGGLALEIFRDGFGVEVEISPKGKIVGAAIGREKPR